MNSRMSTPPLQRHVDFIAQYFLTFCQHAIYCQSVEYWHQRCSTFQARHLLVAWTKSSVLTEVFAVCEVWNATTRPATDGRMDLKEAPEEHHEVELLVKKIVDLRSITAIVLRFVGYSLAVNANQRLRVFMHLVWQFFMFSTLVSKVGVSGKLHLNCFNSVLRNFEDTTEESFASQNSYSPRHQKRNSNSVICASSHVFVLAFGFLHNIIASNTMFSLWWHSRS